MNPLQSNPRGSLPPLRYGVPRKLSAVEISDWSAGSVARGVGGVVSGSSGAAGIGAGGGVEEPAGCGNGRGLFAPLDAHAEVSAAITSNAAAISERKSLRVFVAINTLSAQPSTIRSGSVR
ncbi:MAG TPA: hypothetical protein VLV86_18975 [Vicinamibacterales bacterium]|nr:hypothetical protein [Vicinamibacterales bacterium]